MAKTPQLLLPADYVKDATKLIKNAKSRVSFISMIITNDEATKQLIDNLADAAKRGVQVNVAADMYTYTELSGRFFPSHYYGRKVRATTQMSRRLVTSGAKFHWLGRFSVTTFSGRTHSKWCVVDDTVYGFGGVNVYKRGIENVDYMFKVEDKKLADRLVHEQDRIIRADENRYAYRSYQFASGENTVLVDGGFPGNSIIYSRVCELAKESTHITYVSQYCPTGKLNLALKATDSKLYFNPWKHTTGFNRLIIRFGVLFSRQKTLYRHDRYIHAKFIVFKMKDGSKVAVTGSHNFVHGGVLIGTREVALETRDPVIIDQLESFLNTYIR